MTRVSLRDTVLSEIRQAHRYKYRALAGSRRAVARNLGWEGWEAGDRSIAAQ